MVHLMIALSKRRHDRKRTLTLSHVAHLAGVSPMTVSRAFSRSELVAAPTRERVLSVARKLGYSPNLLAGGLVQNRTATVGVIVLELANPFFAPMLSAIHALAAKRGFLVVVGESARDEEEERRYVEQFGQLRIGWIIINPVTGRLDHLEKARAAGTPVVVMGRRWEDGDYVATDDLRGGRIAARHLLKRGHRRIGIVRMADPNHSPVQARFLSFREVLRSAGVPLPDAWDVRTSGAEINDDVEAVDRLLAQSQPPFAMFVTSDRQALGVVNRLLDLGHRVPEDIAVIGYDDIPYAECSRVPLTTIAVP